MDQLRSGILQQQKPFIQAPQPFHQLQMLSPHQQQLMLAQQNLTSPSANELDNSRRLRALLSNRNMGGLGKDSLSNSVGDVVPNIGSPLQAGVLPRNDPDMLIKVHLISVNHPFICHYGCCIVKYTVFLGVSACHQELHCHFRPLKLFVYM